jgi:formylglycine-generating enzyme required for sulfatase activity
MPGGSAGIDAEKVMSRILETCLCSILLLSVVSPALGQTASPSTPPPRFPKAAQFDANSAPLSAAQHAAMVQIRAGTYTIGSPDRHPLANKAAMPAHQVTVGAFKIDKTEVTNAQFAEFLNALPVKAMGTALGGKVGPANIAQADRALFLEFSSRPSPYTIIDLDDEEARIGVRDASVRGQSRPRRPRLPKQHGPVRSPTAGGVAPGRPLRSNGKRRRAGSAGRPFLGVTRAHVRACRDRRSERNHRSGRQSAQGCNARKACSTWPEPARMDEFAWIVLIRIAPGTGART